MGEAERIETSSEASEALPARRRRRVRQEVSTGRPRASRRRLRLFYFGLAAVWGFLAGTGAVLAALAALGHWVPLGTATVLPVIGGAAGLALLGGLLIAAAYGAATRDRR